MLIAIHHYISSSWYAHPNAPTWNYMSVHISGKSKIIEGEMLWEAVRRLTDKYEKMAREPISLATLPESVQKQMNGLVGFEISIEKVEASFKLSQNRNAKDYENIIQELSQLGTATSKLMAEELRKRGK
ncbi:MAG TPA: FMN-binding negative transcriptional regulator [Cytophagales bacterium]|nr:FMN-binding negative transcriptional regulator [Cytophagales bacterium]